MTQPDYNYDRERKSGEGIHSGDLLIVDRSLEAKDRDVVVVVLNGEFTVKRLAKHQGVIRLLPENPNYQPVTLTASQTCEIWGVVTNVIHAL